MMRDLILLFLISWVSLGHSQTLKEKLNHQFDKYEKAKAFITDYYSNLNSNNRPTEISKEDWEAMLAPDNGFELTQADRDQLIDHFERVTQKNKRTAQNHSIFDLDELRAEGQWKQLRKFCKELPKGGMLHIHPWGTLSTRSIRKILSHINPVLDLDEMVADLQNPESEIGVLYPHELDFLKNFMADFPNRSQWTFNNMNKDQQSNYVQMFTLKREDNPFNRFMAIFKLYGLTGMYKPEVVEYAEKVMWDAFFRRAQRHNVHYIEVTKSYFSTYKLKENIRALNDWADHVYDDYGITVRILGGMLRMNPDLNKNFKVMKGLLQYQNESDILVGINLQADETNHPALLKGQAPYATLMAARAQGKSNLKATMHAGELGYYKNVRDAILLGSTRIGHAIKLMHDPVTLEYARRKNIGVETNLLSNLSLGVVKDLTKHPFLLYLRLGLPVSMSTDDEGIFKTTISKECETAVINSDINYDELKQLSYNSITSSFVDQELKEELLEELDDRFDLFEENFSAN